MNYFDAKELLPKEIYLKYGELGKRYLDAKLENILNFIRYKINKPIVVNNWHLGGQFNWRTIRLPLPGCKEYNQFSDHSYGRAIDFECKDIISTEIQKKILYEWYKDLVALGLTGIEKDTMGWTHITVAKLDGWNGEIINGIKLLEK